MQTPVSNIKDTLLNWNAITIQSSLISAVIIGALIALTTWLLLSWYYGAKIRNVRRQSQQIIATNEQEKNRLSETLDATAQELQRVEFEFSSEKQDFAQLKAAYAVAEVQVNRGLALESQIDSDLASLQTRFFLNQPLPVKAEEQASLSWQRHSSVVNELTNRLKTYELFQLELQQAKSKLNTLLTEQALTIQELNQKVVTQTTRLTQREQDFEAQYALMSQQQEQLKAELLLAMSQLQEPIQLDEQIQSVASILQLNEIDASTPGKGQMTHNAGVLERVAAADKLLDTLSQPAEAAVQSMTQMLKSVVHADEQQAIAEPQADVIIAPSIAPTLVVAETFSKPENAAVLSAQTAAGEAASFSAPKLQTFESLHAVPQVDVVSSIEPLPPAPQLSTKQVTASEPVIAKLQKIFGRLGKGAIVDYVETALEQNDAKLAEQALEENSAESPALPAKLKDLWRKITFTS